MPATAHFSDTKVAGPGTKYWAGVLTGTWNSGGNWSPGGIPQSFEDVGFETLNLSEIVSFTVPENIRSRRVMERLGMSRNPDHDFDHPSLPVGHPLRRHVLYRLQAPARREEQSDDPQAS